MYLLQHLSVYLTTTFTLPSLSSLLPPLLVIVSIGKVSLGLQVVQHLKEPPGVDSLQEVLLLLELYLQLFWFGHLLLLLLHLMARQVVFAVHDDPVFFNAFKVGLIPVEPNGRCLCRYSELIVLGVALEAQTVHQQLLLGVDEVQLLLAEIKRFW